MADGPWERRPRERESTPGGVRRAVTADDLARIGLYAEYVTEDDGSGERIEVPTMDTRTGQCWVWVRPLPPPGPEGPRAPHPYQGGGPHCEASEELRPYPCGRPADDSIHTGYRITDHRQTAAA